MQPGQKLIVVNDRIESNGNMFNLLHLEYLYISVMINQNIKFIRLAL